jgi:TRAP-type C4-dicarboxylate transport system substrate-binding protein
MHRLNLAILVVALACAGLFVTAPGAQAQEFTLRIGSVAPKGTPWSALVNREKKRIQTESGGRIKVKTYLGGKLGSEGSLVRRCQKGQVGGIAVSNGAIGGAAPEIYATELPYLFDNYKQVDRALDAAVELVREILLGKGFVFHMWGENGFRHFASKQKLFKKPGDLKGMKMRAQPAQPHVDMYKALGASAATIAVGEVTSSLANDVVSGYDNTLLYAYATQWHKEVKYVTKSAHIYQAAVVTWCKPWFDTLPPDLQKVVLGVKASDVKKGRAAVRAMNKRLITEYGKSGIQIHNPSASEKAAFKQITAGVHQKFLSSTSAKGKQLYQLLKSNR